MPVPDYDFHPLCTAFWVCDAETFARRKADYQAHPERAAESAVLLAADPADGAWKIADGRHHYLLCKDLGYDCEFRRFEGDADRLAALVLARNDDRRHGTESQRAAARAAVLTWVKGANQHTGLRSNGEHTARAASSKSQAAAAAEAGISTDTLQRAAKVAKKAPELLPAVRDGKIDAKTAAKAADLSPAERKKIAEAADPKKAAKAALPKRSNAEHTARAASSEAKHSNGEDTARAVSSPAAPPTLPPGFKFHAGRPKSPKAGDAWPAPCAVTDGGDRFFPVVHRLPSGSEAVYDAFQTAVPAGAGDAFGDPALKALRDEARAAAAAAAGVFDKFKRLAASTKNPCPWTDFSALVRAAETVARTTDAMAQLVADSLPYAVCPECHGHPRAEGTVCKACRSTGYWPASECDLRPDRLPKTRRPAAG